MLSDCEEPNAPDYGTFELAVDKMAAQFSCLTGYTLRGAEILTCQSDGSGWDIAPPVCGKFLLWGWGLLPLKIILLILSQDNR